MHARANTTALTREMWGGVQTKTSTDGERLGSNQSGRPGTGFPGRSGEGVNGDAGKLPAKVRNLILLNTQSINGLKWVSQLCPRTILHSESSGAR